MPGRKFDQISLDNKELLNVLNKNVKIMTKKLANFTAKIANVKATSALSKYYNLRISRTYIDVDFLKIRDLGDVKRDDIRLKISSWFFEKVSRSFFHAGTSVS